MAGTADHYWRCVIVFCFQISFLAPRMMCPGRLSRHYKRSWILLQFLVSVSMLPCWIWVKDKIYIYIYIWLIYLFGFLTSLSAHFIGHIMTGSFMGWGNQYIRLDQGAVLYTADQRQATTGIRNPISEVGGESVTTAPPWLPFWLLGGVIKSCSVIVFYMHSWTSAIHFFFKLENGPIKYLIHVFKK